MNSEKCEREKQFRIIEKKC